MDWRFKLKRAVTDGLNHPWRNFQLMEEKPSFDGFGRVTDCDCAREIGEQVMKAGVSKAAISCIGSASSRQ